jgi:hypothetical protein
MLKELLSILTYFYLHEKVHPFEEQATRSESRTDISGSASAAKMETSSALVKGQTLVSVKI